MPWEVFPRSSRKPQLGTPWGRDIAISIFCPPLLSIALARSHLLAPRSLASSLNPLLARSLARSSLAHPRSLAGRALGEGDGGGRV